MSNISFTRLVSYGCSTEVQYVLLIVVANHSQCDMMPESSEYLSLAVMTSLLLTCLPVVFRAHIYWTHVEQIHVQDLCLQNITQLLHVSPLILGSNWR